MTVYEDIIYKLNNSKVKYLQCLLDETMSGKAMTLNIVYKINNKLKFLYCKNNFFTPPLRCLLCIVLQPHLIMHVLAGVL